MTALFFLCRSVGKFETGSAKQEQEEEVDSPSSLPAKKPNADMVYYIIAQDVSCPVVTNCWSRTEDMGSLNSRLLDGLCLTVTFKRFRFFLISSLGAFIHNQV